MSNVPSFFQINNIIDQILRQWDTDIPCQTWDSMYPNYPATNHYITKDGTNVLEFDVPGKTEDDFEIKVEEGILFISSTSKNEVENESERKYFTRKMPRRSFKIQFKLSEKLDIEKIQASVKNGILSLTIPLKEEMKPVTKIIQIGK